MNLTKALICLNCGETMKQGGTSIDPYGMTQFRFCDNCGLGIFLFTKIRGFKHSLTRKSDNEIQPVVEADAKCSADFHKEEYSNGSTFCRICGARIRTA